MKIKPEHLNHMRTAIDKTLAANPDIVSRYENGLFPRAGKVRDLQSRFCFDLFNMAGLTPYACKTLYDYANDTHILTALKTIAPKLERNY